MKNNLGGPKENNPAPAGTTEIKRKDDESKVLKKKDIYEAKKKKSCSC